ncbi:hypothetical protein [Paenibacillus campi]|uniref:HNH endonuclease n=1 Tax=Paenibacillus campi TaxID=3106031 RepID=UPI002AFFF671|nr:hypothetical protein [Paenibacillus sp. SGZ-1014]
MEKKLFRTYKRRAVTRKSGFKASGIKTGGECIILDCDSVVMESSTATLTFENNDMQLESLFEMDLGIIAFGGYIKSTAPISLELGLSYQLENGLLIHSSKKLSNELKSNTWNGIGHHVEQQMEPSIQTIVEKATVTLTIHSLPGTTLSFASIDFDCVSYRDYLSKDFYKPFSKKTKEHIPHIYYLATEKALDARLVATAGINTVSRHIESIVLKGCNRCTRYLPINILHEEDRLAFSLHCKKKAPCTHSLFSSYKIDNYEEALESGSIDRLNSVVKNANVVSYYGHQLECRACKKFYVNNALNPLRNAQQFKEDGLRRRALEKLVNSLLDHDLIHHEFEHRTKKQFSEYIWKKFDKRCFKCGEKLKINEMHLDHTMPLAYLYRLDETATCLCAIHNSQKRDSFPINYYSEPQKLEELSQITGLPIDILTSQEANPEVVNKLKEHVVWFFDEFLMETEHQKEKDGIVVADKIYESLVRVLRSTGINLLEEYHLITGKYPSSIKLT